MLFQHYTRLELSHPEDRSIAIEGLIERLDFVFKTQSLAGLFESFWGRCLLWRRADDAAPLKKIPQGVELSRIPPTWSWMAFNGATSFIVLEGGQVDWNNDGVTLPSTLHNKKSWLKTSCQKDSVAIQTKAFDFSIPADHSRSEAYLYYDAAEIAPVKCVIIGSDKKPISDTRKKKHYVLIIKPVSYLTGAPSYERCGFGYMLGEFIHLKDSSVFINIE